MSATSSEVSSANLLTTRRGEMSTCPRTIGFKFTKAKERLEVAKISLACTVQGPNLWSCMWSVGEEAWRPDWRSTH